MSTIGIITLTVILLVFSVSLGVLIFSLKRTPNASNIVKVRSYDFSIQKLLNTGSVNDGKRLTQEKLIENANYVLNVFKYNMNKEQLKRDYKNACNAYLKAFCEKHEYDYDSSVWVADRPGEIACISEQYHVDMSTIIDDIELDAPEEEFLRWYDYCLEMSMIGAETKPNFRSWVRGCPRRSPEEINELKALHDKVEEMKEELKRMLSEKDY